MDGQYHQLKDFQNVTVGVTAINPSPQGTPVTAESQNYKKKWVPSRYHIYKTISTFFGLLWIAPITLLLVFNFMQYSPGASVWCPQGKCAVWNYTGGVDIANAYRLDRNDHDALGALQFGAKALEVWFVFVATSLVYHVAMIYARGSSGLPLGHLMTYVEYSDLRCLFDPILWRSPFPHKKMTGGHRGATIKFFLFSLFAAFMCILANLMGPAVAVLLLPQLQWQDTSMIPISTFQSMAIMEAPTLSALPGCSDADLQARNYSCTTSDTAEALDSWIGSANSFNSHNYNLLESVGYLYGGLSPEGTVTFSVNGSSDVLVFWVPNRQVLQDVTSDHNNFFNTTLQLPADPSFAGYDNALGVSLQRQGPVIGMDMNWYWSNVDVYDVDSTRQIRCYESWSLAFTGKNYTKCSRVGEGWNPASEGTEFFLGNSFGNPTSAVMYSSDKSFFFTSDWNSASAYNPANFATSCFGNGTADPDCDWGAYFDTSWMAPMSNFSSNTITFEFDAPNAKFPQWRYIMEVVMYTEIASYALDPSESNNPMYTVQLDNLPDFPMGPPMQTSIDWMLAALSVSPNGTIPAARKVATDLNAAMEVMADASSSDIDSLLAVGVFVMTTMIWSAQAMSMVPYSFSPPTASDSSVDSTHPLLQRNARLYVWAYGFGTRTSYLGLACTSLGIICVLIRTAILLATSHRQRTAVELVVSAMEHRPSGEFEGLGDNEEKQAKMRFHVDEDSEGKIRFHPRTHPYENMHTPLVPHRQSQGGQSGFSPRDSQSAQGGYFGHRGSQGAWSTHSGQSGFSPRSDPGNPGVSPGESQHSFIPMASAVQPGYNPVAPQPSYSYGHDLGLRW
ncbi:hypothetical protein MMC11_009105 [Xylographa trunciseda]|nr:hypothetical protein [Xylographa trunciseda]